MARKYRDAVIALSSRILHDELMFVVSSLLRATAAAHSALQISELGDFDSSAAGGSTMRSSADLIAAATKSLGKAQAAWRKAVHATIGPKKVAEAEAFIAAEAKAFRAEQSGGSSKKRSPRRTRGQ